MLFHIAGTNFRVVCTYCPKTIGLFVSLVYSVTLTPASSSIAEGATQTLNATAFTKSGAVIPGETFTWLSSDPSVANVNSTGVVTGIRMGTTTITATDAGKTSNPVTVTVTPTGPFLWIPNYVTGTIKAYSRGQQASDYAGAPAVTITMPSGNPNALAFDATGNIWVSDYTGNRLLKYTPAQLTSSGSPTPVVISSNGNNSIQAPIGLALDSGGKLWVANLNNVTVFTPVQLAVSGAPNPLTLAGSDFGVPAGLAFDSLGSLWISMNSKNTVVKYSPSKLAGLSTTPNPLPDVVISSNPNAAPALNPNLPSLKGPEGITFDAAGNLWVANNDGFSVVKYTVTQLGSSGTPAPGVFLGYSGVPARSVEQVGGVVFDTAGNLWVNNETTNAVFNFAPSKLVASGVPNAFIVISSATTNPGFGGLAFGP
jgi:sugar lactone lactonase YvrE